MMAVVAIMATTDLKKKGYIKYTSLTNSLYTDLFLIYDIATTKMFSGIKSRPDSACFLCLKFITLLYTKCISDDKTIFDTSYDGLREPNTKPKGNKLRRLNTVVDARHPLGDFIN